MSLTNWIGAFLVLLPILATVGFLCWLNGPVFMLAVFGLVAVVVAVVGLGCYLLDKGPAK